MASQDVALDHTGSARAVRCGRIPCAPRANDLPATCRVGSPGLCEDLTVAPLARKVVEPIAGTLEDGPVRGRRRGDLRDRIRLAPARELLVRQLIENHIEVAQTITRRVLPPTSRDTPLNDATSTIVDLLGDETTATDELEAKSLRAAHPQARPAGTSDRVHADAVPPSTLLDPTGPGSSTPTLRTGAVTPAGVVPSPSESDTRRFT